MPDKFEYDTESIDGCETTFNHIQVRIKVILDQVESPKNRLMMWRFVIVLTHFLWTVLDVGPQFTHAVWGRFEKFNKGIQDIIQSGKWR